MRTYIYYAKIVTIRYHGLDIYLIQLLSKKNYDSILFLRFGPSKNLFICLSSEKSDLIFRIAYTFYNDLFV